MVKDDGDGVDVDIIVNFNPTANIVGSSNTVKGSNTSESESEIESEVEIESESTSKSKSASEGGDEFVPPGQQNGPPGGGSGDVQSLAEKLSSAKKKVKKSKD